MQHTALYKAVKRGDIIDVRRLLSVGSDPNEASIGNAVLTAAAARGNTPILRLLLDAGAKPDWYALQLAAFNNHAKAVQLLLSAGAPIDAGKGETPLLDALKYEGGRVRVRQLLREAGGRESPDWRYLGWGWSIRYGWWHGWFRRFLYSIGWLPKRRRHSN